MVQNLLLIGCGDAAHVDGSPDRLRAAAGRRVRPSFLVRAWPRLGLTVASADREENGADQADRDADPLRSRRPFSQHDRPEQPAEGRRSGHERNMRSW